MTKNSKFPTGIDSSQFGLLKLDLEMSEYSAGYVWNGHEVNLLIAFDQEVPIEKTLVAAGKLVENTDLWFEGLKTILADEVFPDLEQYWLAGDSEHKDVQTFLKSVYPEEIEINSSGFVTINFGGVSLIDDHWISIMGSPETGPEYSAING